MANWEGGIRVNAFVSGGFIPQKMRGQKLEELITGWDWYATFAALAGVDPIDHKAVAANLPPIDSYNMWPLLSGEAHMSPRTELALGDMTDGAASDPSSQTLVGGLIWPVGSSWYKLLLGNVSMTEWTGPEFPNTSSWGTEASFMTTECGRTSATGCLYDVMADPGEHSNIASANPQLFYQMLARIQDIQATVFSPNRGVASSLACEMALKRYNGFWGPFVGISNVNEPDTPLESAGIII